MIRTSSCDGDRYNNSEEMLRKLRKGIEIEFGYLGKQYSSSYSGQGLHATEFYKPETEKIYKTPDECLNDYEIDGKELIDIVKEIDVYAH